jgi:uncharacterized protein
MPPTLLSPGVYIEELPSAVRTITGVPTSITAFVGAAWRGPVNEPIDVSGYPDFERKFGGLWRASLMSYAVQQFFANGGSRALVVRVTNGADAPNAAASAAKFVLAGGTKLEAASPGSWANNLVLAVDPTAVPDLPPDAGRFNLTILDDPNTKSDSRKLGGSGLAESFFNVSVTPGSPRYILTVLAAQSKLLRVEGNAVANVGANAPTAVATVTVGTQGRDGSNIVSADIQGATSAVAKTGMYALAKADIFNLLCLPPVSWQQDVDVAVWPLAAKLCADSRAVLLIDAPRSWDVPTATTSANTNALAVADRSYAAIYFPRLRIPDPLAENKLDDFAPCGVVAGVISRTDAERGVWKAPAGIDAALSGVYEFSVAGQRANLDDSDSGSLNPVAVNGLRSIPGVGPVVWGARTMAGRDTLASQWKYLPVRRVALYIEESLFRGTQWVVFEPNDEPLWSQIRLNVGAFMHSLFRQGAFQGTTPREAYLVKCDKETTTQDDINRGVVNILVGFAPLKPAEFVVIQIQQLAGQIQT